MIRDAQSPTDARSQVRGSMLLLAGRLLALAINLAVQILLVRHLSKVEYGSFSFAISVVALGANLSLLGLNKSFTRFGSIYHEQRDYSRMAGTAVLVLATVIGLGLAFVLVTITTSRYLTGVIFENDLSLTLLLTLIALVPIDSLDRVFHSCFSVFAEVRSVFFRRHILAPSLKLAAIVFVISIGADVQMLAACYLGAGLLGLLFYAALLARILRREDLVRHFRPGKWTVPVRELFSYSLPLFSSQFCFLFRGALVVLLLEILRDSESVAEFRSVLPFARLNLVVHESFLFLFVPLASRMFARNESGQINELYWKSTLWVAVLTFPIFLATVVVAKPLTIFMLGERYASSAMILSVLAAAFFVDAILGYAAHTLRVYARIRQIVIVDVISLIVALGLNLLLIPRYGAMGAAIATLAGVVGQNVGYLAFMRWSTDIGRMHDRFARVCLSFVVVGGVLAAIQWMLSPPPVAALALVAASGIAVFFWNRSTLAADAMFPELARLPIIGRLVDTGGNVSSPSESIPFDSPESQRQQVLSRLRDQAAHYFPNLQDEFSVRLRGVNRRLFSTLYDVEVTDGQQRFAVAVKETAKPEDVHQTGSDELVKSIPDRFRPTPDPKGYERAALLAIDRHFSELSDQRFETVRVLDEWFDGWAFVMERVPYPSLSRLLRRAMRGSMRPLDLAPAARHAGAWLKEFHGSRPPAHAQSGGDPAARFTEDVACLRELLDASGEVCGPFQDALCHLPELAAEILTADLPMGLAHDDFAPRNVLVAPSDAVLVIDTLAEETAPAYEDLAHFLVHLKGHKLQMIGRGLPLSTSTLAALEREFLSGYFGDGEIPLQAIRVFEMKALIARWATLQRNHGSRQRSHRLKQAAWRTWTRPFFARMLRRLREEAEDSGSRCRVADQQSEMSSFVNRLTNRSGSYFDDLTPGTPRIAPGEVRENRFSTIYSASIAAGSTSHRVIAKVPRNSDRGLSSARVDDRPRLAPLLTPREEAEREYAALIHIHRHLSSCDSGRLRSVRPLDFCPQNGAVILEAVDAPTLHDRIQNNGKTHAANLTEFFASAGRWLRSLHDLPLPDHCQTRDATRQEFLANVSRYTAYLQAHGVDRRFLQTIEDSLASLSEQSLPRRLPLGLCHGDFAPHNLFAYADGTVAAFDTLCDWQAPIYEDLAHFLFVLKWEADQPRSRGLDDNELTFLEAYFEDGPVPLGAVQSYMLLILLDKWASAVQGVRRAGSLKKIAKRTMLPRRQRRFRQFAEQLLAGIREDVEGSPVNSPTDPFIPRSV